MIPFTSKKTLLRKYSGQDSPFFLIAGPCVIEDWQIMSECAEQLQAIADRLGIVVFFKASYDKANRSSLSSFRGPGLEKGLQILSEIRSKYNLPIVTDVHSIEQVQPVADVVDMIQIPAFLCRQTDLVVAVAQTQKLVNIKKGQFLAPQDVENMVGKIKALGNDNFFVTERGYTFGYNNLIVDPRAFDIIRKKNIAVIFDATHSVQMPGGGKVSGGNREHIFVQARAAVAAGVEGLFFEVHPHPEKGLSDATNMLPLGQLFDMVSHLLKIDALVKGR